MTTVTSWTIEPLLVTHGHPAQELLSVQHGGDPLLDRETGLTVCASLLRCGPLTTSASLAGLGSVRLHLRHGFLEDGLNLLDLIRTQGERLGHALETLCEVSLHARRIGWTAMAASGALSVASAGGTGAVIGLGRLRCGKRGDTQREHQAEGGQGSHGISCDGATTCRFSQ